VYPLKFPFSPCPATAKRIATRPANGWRYATLAALATLLVLIGFGARAADDKPAVEATPPVVKIAIHYLGKAYEEPVPLSLVDPLLTDNGLQGARLAIQDNNKSGQFLGQEYDLVEDIVPADGDVAAKAKEILKDGPAIIIADLEANDLLCTQLKAKLGVRTLPELMRIAIQHLPSASAKTPRGEWSCALCSIRRLARVLIRASTACLGRYSDAE
jgi:hypothetical protein